VRKLWFVGVFYCQLHTPLSAGVRPGVLALGHRHFYLCDVTIRLMAALIQRTHIKL